MSSYCLLFHSILIIMSSADRNRRFVQTSAQQLLCPFGAEKTISIDPRSSNTPHAKTAPNSFRTLAFIPSHPTFRAHIGGRRAFEDDLKITMRLKCPLQQTRGGAMDPQVRQRFPPQTSTDAPNPPTDVLLDSITFYFICTALPSIFSSSPLLRAGAQARTFKKWVRKLLAYVHHRVFAMINR